MYTSLVIQSQLLATKFFVPVRSSPVIARPRLNARLDKSLKYPLTLVSASAGFGKTTLLSSWAHSLPASNPLVAWVSLDEEDNDPQLFWTYILSALDQQQPERFTSLLKYLQSPEIPPLTYILTALINLVVDSTQHFLLILDDYHLITEQHIHTTLSYLVEHLPPQLHIVLSTRSDPPLLLSQLRARQRVLEIRTEQLRCTAEETRTLFQESMGIQLMDETIQEVTARTEGWLVGLQLLGLSLSELANPTTLLQEISGDQRYILDYLTEIVLLRQPQEIQMFLLSTSILERLTASLCDTVMQKTGSQQILQQLEQSNVFMVSLDSKREWYRYHGLFAEALYYQLKQTHADLVPLLHYRASLWYAQHDQTIEAILHALHAKEWQWTADLIERKSVALNALSWGVSHYQLFLLRDWLKQIPEEVVSARPRLCLARIWMLLLIAPETMLETWLDAVEAMLTDALSQPDHQISASAMQVPQIREELENMLGEAFTYRAILHCIDEDGEAVLALCQQAQALLSPNNVGVCAQIAVAQFMVIYASSINNATKALQIGLQAGSLNQAAGNTDQALSVMGLMAMNMIGTGRLHETQRLTQQAILFSHKSGACVLPRTGWPMVWQAELLREWNQLDEALSCIEEAIKLLTQLNWTVSPAFIPQGYVILLRISLSRGDLARARSALQEIERFDMHTNYLSSLYQRSLFITIDHVRFWIACGKLDRAIHWAEMLDVRELPVTPYTHEREEVARARIFLAKKLPHLALQKLDPVLQRAATGQRWGHVIEIRLLQALAHHMCQEETQAISVLADAIRLAEPEGYIRSFVDEGAPMEILLSTLREQQRLHGTTSYLDTILAAFSQQTS